MRYAQLIVESTYDNDRRVDKFFFVTPKGEKEDFGGCEPKEVVVALNKLAEDGWRVVGVTSYTNHRHGGKFSYPYSARPHQVIYLLEMTF